MRTFIFIKNERRNNKLYRVIVGMTQSETYPSDLTRFEDSKFYACDCIEISEECHIELGIIV